MKDEIGEEHTATGCMKEEPQNTYEAPPLSIGKPILARLSVVGFFPGVPATGATPRVCLVSN